MIIRRKMNRTDGLKKENKTMKIFSHFYHTIKAARSRSLVVKCSKAQVIPLGVMIETVFLPPKLILALYKVNLTIGRGKGGSTLPSTGHFSSN
jgi:hypothetical protein